ncbi:MAG TPA: DUF4252 domain-containing protein [Thermoanaerobaculia bacterium]|nr:DUF4252 domain-containing protein [Thermoanaerobaculia bacterium]
MNTLKRRISILLCLTAALMALPAAAQDARINFDAIDLSALTAKAEEVIEVTLDGDMLRLASRFLSTDEPDEAAVRDLVSGLSGVYVRSFTFSQPGMYDPKIVERFRTAIGPGWEKIVNVRSRGENAEIYVRPAGDRLSGLVILAAEPKELTIVNIVGPIDLARLAELEGSFGIPDLEIGKKPAKGAER